MEDYTQIVRELNDELYEKFGEVTKTFSFTTDGFYTLISFDGVMLWNSEDNGREFDEETNNYEPMIPYLKRKFNQYVDELVALKFTQEEMK